MTTIPAPGAAPTPDAALAEATRRAERLAEHGPTVRGLSVTASLAVISVFMTVVVPVLVFGEPWGSGPVVVTVVGMVLAIRAWVVGRRRHTLQPFRIAAEERPFSVLDRTQRRLLWRRITGRTSATADTVPLVRAFLGWQRRSSRGAVPSLIALGVVMLGSAWAIALSSGDVLLLVLLLVVAVFIGAMTAVESRRRERVLRSLPDPPSPECSAAAIDQN
ncbi:hypothetical protein DEJ33_00445 [Curtobacterium sp. MCPF17_047]|uniref:hypothetical protein n=2 Tax=Curtobacterium TaxID=2034 RepID=UPI000DA88F9B|nr:MULTISPECIES: hypothetical protein [unclassified Curtobacterium]PZE62949.1 hypothetical protein DEJ24_01430 [Curtobacterium sp. MCPF17_001]PZF68879.1 hypothetical protein DEJ33_00445 [Curtobacterium sp. MCPF17_047]